MLTEKRILEKYSKFSSITEIKQLDIWGEEIEDIRIIERMKNLRILSLSSNRISSLAPLAGCTNLREIYLRNNNIYSYEELYHLRNMKNLKTLWLEGNPIAKDIFYINKVLNILPNLQYLDNKYLLINKVGRKRIFSEEQKQIKNQCDYNINRLNTNQKKILLRRVFSYFEPSNDAGGAYVETSNDGSLCQNKKNKCVNNGGCNNIKKVDLSEFKIKFNTKGKSAKKERKNFKKIKLKIKSDNRYINNLFNNYIIYNESTNGRKISDKKLTVDTQGNINKYIIKENNNTVQNSIIQQQYLSEKKEFKVKKITFFGNKRKNLYNNEYKCRNDEKISININHYENNNNNLMKAVYSLVDKMNIQNLLSLKEVINQKLSTFNK